jgi:hypothetical protein
MGPWQRVVAHVRLNANEHGARSRVIPEGLLHENPDRTQRTEQYLDDLQSRDAMEPDIVHQMARLSRATERADRLEIAHMADHVDQATKARLEESHPKTRGQLRVLGRKQLSIAATEDVKLDRLPPRGDDHAQ